MSWFKKKTPVVYVLRQVVSPDQIHDYFLPSTRLEEVPRIGEGVTLILEKKTAFLRVLDVSYEIGVIRVVLGQESYDERNKRHVAIIEKLGGYKKA